MPEGRMLKKIISQSQKLPRLKSDSARLLYTWLIPHLDINGRFSADPFVIKGYVVPRLKMSIKKVWEYLVDMAANDLIRLYEVDGDKYLEVVKFKKYQTLSPKKEGKPLIPPLKKGRELLRSRSNTSKVKESKVKERDGQSEFDQLFEEFWKAYPKKRHRDYAKEIFITRARQGLIPEIAKALNGYLDYLKHRRVHDNFKQEPMDASTFLNKNRWKEYKDFKYEPPL